MRRWPALLLFLLFSHHAVASMPALQLPPLGWEERVTPGYVPSIEGTLVKMGLGEVTEPASPWAQWDAGAVGILQGLLEAPEWEAYEHHALRLLAHGPHAEAREWLEQTVKTLGMQEDLTSPEGVRLYTLLSEFSSAQPELARAMQAYFLEQANAGRGWSWAMSQLIAQKTRGALERAQVLVAQHPDVGNAQGLRDLLEQAWGHVRAQEPMLPTGTSGDAK
jgi:hypothetical protein